MSGHVQSFSPALLNAATGAVSSVWWVIVNISSNFKMVGIGMIAVEKFVACLS